MGNCRIFCIAFLLLFAGSLLSSQSLLFTGVRAFSCAGTSGSMTPDAWSAGTNPALLSGLLRSSVAFGCIPALYGLTELQTSGAALTIPFGGAGVGIDAERIGGRLFSRQSLMFGIGFCPAPGWRSGFGMSIRRESYERYGSASCLTCDPSIVVGMGEGMHVGVQVTNAFGTVAGNADIAPPRDASCAVTWHAESGADLMLAIRTIPNASLARTLAGEYRLHPSFVIRCGIGDAPTRIAFGGEGEWGDVAFLFGAEWHAELGWSRAIELQWTMGEDH